MSIIAVLLILVVIGFVLWLINAKVPMESTMKTILNAVVALLTVLWLLDIFGVINSGVNWGCDGGDRGADLDVD